MTISAIVTMMICMTIVCHNDMSMMTGALPVTADTNAGDRSDDGQNLGTRARFLETLAQSDVMRGVAQKQRYIVYYSKTQP